MDLKTCYKRPSEASVCLSLVAEGHEVSLHEDGCCERMNVKPVW